MKTLKNKSPEIPKFILKLAGLLAFFSTKWVTWFAIKLFTTPIRHKIPRRELEMDQKSRQSLVPILAIKKKVMVYEYGEATKKILLVHGWSGRGTQLVRLADELLAQGFSTVSFDAPAHGKSTGSTTLMPEFMATVLQLEQEYGPFEAAIGHSLGSMALLNATKNGLKIKKLVVIGTADKIEDILAEFVKKIGLKRVVAERMKQHFEQKFGALMDDFAASEAAKRVLIPTLVVHDRHDFEVPIACGSAVFEELKQGVFLETERLGHRKILGDKVVVLKIIDFIV